MKLLVNGLIVALITAGVDQWSKWYIFGLLGDLEYPVMPILPFFDLVMVRNYGISFGMLHNLPYGQLVLSFVAMAIVAVLCRWLYTTTRAYVAVALGLIIGGAVGNIIDRVRLGAVSDFLDFYIGSYHWPAFNVADSAVFIGVVILCIDSYLEHRAENECK